MRSIRRWEVRMREHRPIPLKSHEDSVFVTPKHSRGYCLYIHRGVGLSVPLSLLSDAQLVTHCVRVTLFHTGEHAFFGTTYACEPVAAESESHRDDTKGIYRRFDVSYALPVFFHTSLPSDGSVVVVLECVCTTESKKGDRKQFSVGWTTLQVMDPALNFDMDVSQLENFNFSSTRMRESALQRGTPRSLFLHSEGYDRILVDTLQQGSHVEYGFFPHTGMSNVIHLFPEHCIVPMHNKVPGMIQQGDLLRPLTDDTFEITVSRMRLKVPANFEGMFLKIVGDNLRDTYGARFPEMPEDRSTLVTVEERSLKIGLHNGYGFITMPTTTPVSVESNTGDIVFRGSMPLDGVFDDPSLAVIFELEYGVQVPLPNDEVRKRKKGAPPAVQFARHMMSLGHVVFFPFAEKLESSLVSLPLLGGPFRSYTRPKIVTVGRSRYSPQADGVILEFRVSGLGHEDEEFDDEEEEAADEYLSEEDVMDHEDREQEEEREVSSVPEQEVVQPEKEVVSEEESEEEEDTHTESVVSKVPQEEVKEEEEEEPDTEDKEPEESEASRMKRQLAAEAGAMRRKELEADVKKPVPRTTLAHLFSAGIPDIVDSEGKRIAGDSSETASVNRFIFQFLGFSSKSDEKGHFEGVSRCVFFTFKFFDFPAASTQTMFPRKEGDDEESLYLLYSESSSEKKEESKFPGTEVRFEIDPSEMHSRRYKKFVRYVRNENVLIDVWDGDSLLLIGSVSIPLASIFERGEDHEKVHTGQYPLVQCVLFGGEEKNKVQHSILLRLARLMGTKESYTSRQLEKPSDYSPCGPVRKVLARRLTDMNDELSGALRRDEAIGSTLAPHEVDNVGKVLDADLETIKLYRSARKKAAISQLLKSKISEKRTVHISLGEGVLIESEFVNPRESECVFRVVMHDDSKEVSLIRDAMEWRAFKNSEYGEDIASGVVEDGLFTQDDKFYLMGRERSFIPLLVRFMDADNLRKERRVVEIRIEDVRKKEILKIIELEVLYHPPIVNQTFFFWEAENEFMKRSLKVGGEVTVSDVSETLKLHGSAENWRDVGGTVKCTDSRAVAALRKLESDSDDELIVHVKFRTPKAPCTSRFFVILYREVFCVNVWKTFELVVESVWCTEMSGIVGQTSVRDIDVGSGKVIPGLSTARRVCWYSSDSVHMDPRPNTPFHVSRELPLQLSLGFRPSRKGLSSYLLHLVDVNSKEAVVSIRITANATMPLISKSFELRLSTGVSTNKRVAYRNPYPFEKSFHLHSNKPDILKFRSDILDVPSKDKKYIQMVFAPKLTPGNDDVLVFINDSDDKNEECLLLRLTYE